MKRSKQYQEMLDASIVDYDQLKKMEDWVAEQPSWKDFYFDFIFNQIKDKGANPVKDDKDFEERLNNTNILLITS